MRWIAAVERNLAAFEPVELREQVTASWAKEAHVETQEGFARLMREQFPFHFADPLDPRIEDYLTRTADTIYAPDVLRHASAAGYGGIEVEDRLDEVASADARAGWALRPDLRRPGRGGHGRGDPRQRARGVRAERSHDLRRGA